VPYKNGCTKQLHSSLPIVLHTTDACPLTSFNFCFRLPLPYPSLPTPFPHPSYLIHGLQIVLEVRHEMVLGLRGNAHAHSGEICAGIAGDERITDAAHHPGEAHQGLCVFPVREETVALQDGCLHVAGGVMRWGQGPKTYTEEGETRVGIKLGWNDRAYMQVEEYFFCLVC